MGTTAERQPRRCHRCGEPLAVGDLAGNCLRCLSTLLLLPEPADGVESSPSPVIRRLGDYELLEEVARGGMGVVFRARQVSLDRTVAVKVLRDAWLATPMQVKRFQAEAANAAKLKHPNIVAVHEVGEQGGQHYFAMDLIQGMNLAEATREGPLTSRRAAELLRKVAEAAQHAHREGVLHRDIKPSNVLLDARGEPHVTDFGLARPLDGESSLTLTGQVLGTPGY
ncbi:MAG: serine/threonine protein kinase, partial [Verrucomicrobiales bacterium]|nr:serine/threonine protein kinase [Verrucomicrobiales bacterium]